MIRVREHMDVVVLHARDVELVEQGQCVLHVDVVVSDAVHNEEAHVLGERVHVGDGGVVVAGGVVLRGVHVAFGVDGICNVLISKMVVEQRRRDLP